MDQYAGRFRPVFVFAPRVEDSNLHRQRYEFDAEREALRERDIALVEIVGDHIETILGPACDRDGESLRQSYGVVTEEFVVLLCGKDTGVKLRSDEPIAAARLCALVDSMPMRIREMKKSN